MIIPELPEYLTSLGGEQYKGLIISLFTLTAMISRPFSGKIADKIGRVPVMIFGTAVCFVMSLIYPVVTTVAGFLLLRLVHGFSTGFAPTGATAYLADIIPAEKRGEAMGLLGTMGTVGMALGPSIGGLLANRFSLDVMFYCSSFLALLSIVILLGIRETVRERHRFTHQVLKIRRQDLFEPRVLMPCLVMLLATYAYGAVFTVMPDFGKFVGIQNKGLLFTFLTVASLSVRLIAGKASDRFGRRQVLLVSTALITFSMLLFGLGTTPRDLMIAVSLYGLAQGMTSPTLMAWATDLSDSQHKGRGISSLYIFMELGIGLGALFSGFIYGNEPGNFFVTFLTCGLLSALAFTYLIYLMIRQRSVRTV